MEAILDSHQALTDQLNAALDAYEQNQKAYRTLRAYYGSEQFLRDVEASNQGQIPAGIKCGVLSEDAVFDLIGDNFNTAVRMLEIATAVIKDH